jgi:hypothetical protein
LLLPLLLAAGAQAQPLRIYSEFQRVDPFGQMAAPDRGGAPREILSPAIARNAYASFLVAVKPPRDGPVTIHIGQNPEDTLQPTLYRAAFTETARGWIPDRLEPVPQPYTFDLASAATVPGQTVVLLWLDLWTPARTPAERMRVEVQMNWGERWVIAPMEVRVQEATLPKPPALRLALPPLETPLGEVARWCWRALGCAGPRPASARPQPQESPSIRSLVARNVAQDILHARERKKAPPPDACAESLPANLHPEWYLRARTALWR